jgi:hypothetical protein
MYSLVMDSSLRYLSNFFSSPTRVFRRHLNNIQVKLCSTYIVGRNTLQTAVLVRTSSQMASFISKVWQLSTFINVTKDLHTHLPIKSKKKTHFKTIYNIFNLEPTLCQCGCAKERGLVGIKIQGDYCRDRVGRVLSKYRRPTWSRLGILCIHVTLTVHLFLL